MADFDIDKIVNGSIKYLISGCLGLLLWFLGLNFSAIQDLRATIIKLDNYIVRIENNTNSISKNTNDIVDIKVRMTKVETRLENK